MKSEEADSFHLLYIAVAVNALLYFHCYVLYVRYIPGLLSCISYCTGVLTYGPDDETLHFLLWRSQGFTIGTPEPVFYTLYLHQIAFYMEQTKNVRTFSVPISCMYNVLNQRQIVLQKCVGGNVRSIRTPEKGKWDLVKLPWDLLRLKYYLFPIFMSKEWNSLSAEFLLLVYRQRRFWISIFLWSSSCVNPSFFRAEKGGGLGGKKLYKPFNDLANLAVQTFILYIFRWE